MTRYDEPQHAELRAALGGTKPLAIIERRKAPLTYKWFDEYGGVTVGSENVDWHWRDGPEGWEFLVGDPKFIAAFLELEARRSLYSSRFAFQCDMGRLLGYPISEDQDVAERGARAWWLSIGGCGCSKCGGPITAEERIELSAYKARTQPYPRGGK